MPDQSENDLKEFCQLHLKKLKRCSDIFSKAQISGMIGDDHWSCREYKNKFCHFASPIPLKNCVIKYRENPRCQ